MFAYTHRGGAPVGCDLERLMKCVFGEVLLRRNDKKEIINYL